MGTSKIKKKMKLNFSLFVSALASPRTINVEDYITRADQVLTGGFGTYLECPYGRVMRGTCTSGNDKDCRYNGTKYSHIVWCGENQELAQDFASYCYWILVTSKKSLIVVQMN